jgi:hypothetical protein
MKRFGVILMAFVLVLGLTQCKKSSLAPTDNNGKVFMTLEAGCGNSKTVFNPENYTFNWANAGGKEYIYVASNTHGYLGTLEATTDGVTGGQPANTTRLRFTGEIKTFETSDELYFYYLGNDKRTIADNATSFEMVFSGQSDATTSTVANLLVALAKGSVQSMGDEQYKATADLTVEIAIAKFKFYNGDSSNDVILYGSNEGGDYDIYKSAIVRLNMCRVDHKEGSETSASDGINLGAYSANKELYVALVPNTEQKTTLYFKNGATNSGSIIFNRGIVKNTYYTNPGGNPLNVNLNPGK